MLLAPDRIAEALRAWSQSIGADHVLGHEQTQERYGADTTGAERVMPGALLPRTAQEVQACVRIAAAHGVPLHPISTGRNWGYGTALPAQDGCVVLDLSGLQRILHFDRELGVVTLEPGVTQGMLHAFLQAQGNEFMVPTTGAGPDCSLVGNALERGYGITPIGDHFAAVTDLQAVLPDGSLYRSTLARLGGDDLARLYKWGIGPYEQGLFTQGRAGVVTQMSLVLARRPPVVELGMFSLSRDELLEEAVLRVRAILRALPGVVGGINLMNQLRVLAMTAPYPFHECGPGGVLPPSVVARMGSEQQVQPWTGVITLYGTRRMVAAARNEIRRQLRGVGSRLVFVSPGMAAWLGRAANAVPGHWLGGRMGKLSRTAQALHGALEIMQGIPNRTAMPLAYWRQPGFRRTEEAAQPPDPARDGCGLVWYAPLVPMRPEGVRAHLQLVQEILPRHGLEPLITFTSLNDRLFDATTPLLFDRHDPSGSTRVNHAYSELLSRGRAIGTFPYRVGIQQWEAIRANASGTRAPHPAEGSSLLIDPGRYVG